jgi:hypothetical protein
VSVTFGLILGFLFSLAMIFAGSSMRRRTGGSGASARSRNVTRNASMNRRDFFGDQPAATRGQRRPPSLRTAAATVVGIVPAERSPADAAETTPRRGAEAERHAA